MYSDWFCQKKKSHGKTTQTFFVIGQENLVFMRLRVIFHLIESIRLSTLTMNLKQHSTINTLKIKRNLKIR